jgi:AraC family transcriptional regulator
MVISCSSVCESQTTLLGTAEDDLPDLANVDYVARVNRAIDYIVQNLTEPLDLDQVARVAHFSSFHFHRVFKALVGETLAAFVKRVRLQRALQMMSHRPDATLTDIALACGFASSSDFSRSFKQRYGIPPRAFDVRGFRDHMRDAFTPGLARLPAGENPDRFVVTFRSYPTRFVAYVRVRDSFAPGAVQACARRLVGWAERRGYAQGQWLGYMWDDPEVVAMDKCRYDLGVEVPQRIHPDGEVGCVELPPMTVAQVEIRGGVDLELRALDWLYRTWLPGSGFVPDDQPCFEAFHGLPFAHGDTHFELDAQVPVVDGSTPL